MDSIYGEHKGPFIHLPFLRFRAGLVPPLDPRIHPPAGSALLLLLLGFWLDWQNY